MNTLGYLLALHVGKASADDCAEVGGLAEAVQEVTGDRAATAAEAHGIELEAVKLPTVKKEFVLLPQRWVVERSFAWATRFRALHYRCLPNSQQS